MMNCICLALTLPCLVGPMKDDAPLKWQSVPSKEGGFTVEMPDKPTQSKKKVTTMTGHLHVTLLVAHGRGDALYVVSYCDFPEKDIKDGPVAQRLDQARDAAVTSVRGKLRSEKSLKLDKHPGREIAIEKDGEIVARLRIYVVKRRLYQVMTLGAVAPKDATRFLESFRLNK